MNEFKKGFTWGIYKILNALKDCKDMEDVETIQEGYEGILVEYAHLITDLIKKEEKL